MSYLVKNPEDRFSRDEAHIVKSVISIAILDRVSPSGGSLDTDHR